MKLAIFFSHISEISPSGENPFDGKNMMLILYDISILKKIKISLPLEQVHCYTFDSNSDWFLFSCDDKPLTAIYLGNEEFESKTFIGQNEVLKESVTCVCEINSIWIAAASKDKKIRIYDYQDIYNNPIYLEESEFPVIEAKKEFPGHEDSIKAMSFSSDGSMLASYAMDNTIRIWDINHDQCKQIIKWQSMVDLFQFIPHDETKIIVQGGDKMQILDFESLNIKKLHQDEILSAQLFHGNFKILLHQSNQVSSMNISYPYGKLHLYSSKFVITACAMTSLGHLLVSDGKSIQFVGTRYLNHVYTTSVAIPRPRIYEVSHL